MRRLAAILLLLPGLVFAETKKGTQYAFLVGCSGYAETQLKPLPYTINDVEQFRQALLETGFENDHIKLLHDKQPLRYAPEKKKILKEFAMLLEGLKPEDTVVVALSGHGIHFKKDATGYFCPLDSDLKDKTTLIPFEGKDGLFDQLKACKARRKLLIVNACRNDPTSDRAQAAEKIDLDDAAPETVPEGIAAIYSCKPGQKSYYDPKRQQGVFFDHVTKAWRGEYAKGQEQVTIEDIFREVSLRTKADVDKTYGESQVPEVKREYKEEWRLQSTSQIAVEHRDYELTLKQTGTSAEWIKKFGPKRFMDWHRLAEGGNTTAMLFAGRCYLLGAGVAKDEKRGAEWFRKAADLGNSHAMNNLGLCYDNGSGVAKEEKQAAEWFRKAADLGNSNAMCNLGASYYHGTGVAEDEKQAAEWFRKAANLGNSDGMRRLGISFFSGAGVAKDERQATELFRKAADLGNRGAIYRLGFSYFSGAGIQKDEEQAVKLFRKAAELGESDAMADLGVCYYKGEGIGKDRQLAAEWFRKAATLECVKGMRGLGYCFEYGQGVEKDEIQAIDWYRKASALGDEISKQELKRLGKE